MLFVFADTVRAESITILKCYYIIAIFTATQHYYSQSLYSTNSFQMHWLHVQTLSIRNEQLTENENTIQ